MQLKSTGKYDLQGHLHVLAQHWRWYKEGTKSKEPDEELTGHDLCSVSQRIKCASVTGLLRKSLTGPPEESNSSTGLVCLVRSG